MNRKFLFAIIIVFAFSSTSVFAEGNEPILKIIQKNPHVAKYVQELQKTISELTEKNSGLEETVKSQQEKIEQLNQTIDNQKQTINTQQETIDNLTIEKQELKDEIQYIDVTIGIYEGKGSDFGYLKSYLVNKEVTFTTATEKNGM
jgi:peptidoglycan hydrolase CwlO-like protein